MSRKRHSNASKGPRNAKPAKHADEGEEEGEESLRRGGGKPWTSVRQGRFLEARIDDFETSRQSPKKVGLKAFWRQTIQEFLKVWPLEEELDNEERNERTDALTLVRGLVETLPQLTFLAAHQGLV